MARSFGTLFVNDRVDIFICTLCSYQQTTHTKDTVER